MSNLFSRPKVPKKSAEQIAGEKAQATELSNLQAQESSRKKAAGRSRRGRASLIATSERGVQDTLG